MPYKKNQTSTYSAYQLEKGCLLVKGCAATIFGILIFQNIMTFWREMWIFQIEAAQPLSSKRCF